MRLIPSGKTRKLSGIMLTVGGVVLAVTTTPAFAIPSEFTPGDLVVYGNTGNIARRPGGGPGRLQRVEYTCYRDHDRHSRLLSVAPDR